MRVYVPATLAGIRRALADGAVEVRSGYGFAVTEPLRLEYPDWSEEDLEYLAMQDASRASLQRLRSLPAGRLQASAQRTVTGRRPAT